MSLRGSFLPVAIAAWAGLAAPALADGGDDAAAAPEWYSIHAQSTVTTQYHPPFTSPLSGPNSLGAAHNGRESADATLYLGIRLCRGLEFYVDPEVDQGFGLSDTLGIAGFPNGEALKVGASRPYFEMHRAFARYTVGLGGADEKVDPDQNQLGGTRQADNVTFTAGKLAVTDIFDTNSYAHDPRSDFLNWSLMDSGAFDFAANAWGYTYGGAVEWKQSWWTVRGGFFDLSNIPNQVNLDPSFDQFELVAELEERHTLHDHPGKLKLLAFANRARMADYNDALRLDQATGTTPDVSVVRRWAIRPGVALNLEQELMPDLGMFARASLNDGHKESYEFTEIDRSVATGLSLNGKGWRRPDDTVGLAGALNDISKDARNYLAAGGLGILIGDGGLPKAGFEEVLETYYKAGIVTGIELTLDYQHVLNPGYDAARGPVDVFGFRVHAEF